MCADLKRLVPRWSSGPLAHRCLERVSLHLCSESGIWDVGLALLATRCYQSQHPHRSRQLSTADSDVFSASVWDPGIMDRSDGYEVPSSSQLWILAPNEMRIWHVPPRVSGVF